MQEDKTKSEKEKAKQSQDRYMIPVLGVSGFLLILAVAYFILCQAFYIEIHMTGEKNVTLEYGETYEELGATATVKNKLVGGKARKLEVKVEAPKQMSDIGEYKVKYIAQYQFMRKKVIRTVKIQDTTPPEITLTEKEGYIVMPDATYEEEGFCAKDNRDGDITDKVKREEVDGEVIYTVSDEAGNETKVTRKIRYKDMTAPEIVVNGATSMSLSAGSSFVDPGATATDNEDGDITSSIRVEGTVNPYRSGEYTIRYIATDAAGNVADAIRTVTVTPIRQGDDTATNGKVIYLTFDDGPGPYTQKLLDVLDMYNVKVTFFTVNGGYNELLKKEADAGHTVAIHSFTHKYNQIYASVDNYMGDFYAQQRVIAEYTGKTANLFRFPGGSSNQVSTKYCKGIMSALTSGMQAQGYVYFDWNVVSGDAGETTSTEQVIANVKEGCMKHNTSVVLQHDIKEFSVDAVEEILAWGIANGYTFLPLSEGSPTAHQTVKN